MIGDVIAGILVVLTLIVYALIFVLVLYVWYLFIAWLVNALGLEIDTNVLFLASVFSTGLAVCEMRRE